MDNLEQIIGYDFENKDLLMQAVTHSSYTNEHKSSVSYERLEFLGDAVLGLIVSNYLYKLYPLYNEGKLTTLRKKLVNRDTLADIAEKKGLLPYLRVGGGDKENIINSSVKMKCDLFEAIVGAIWLDSKGNLPTVSEFVISNLQPYVDIGEEDYKSKLFEYCAKNKLEPIFIMTDNANNENEQTFTMELRIDGKGCGVGMANTKKGAEQNASKNYLENL